MRPQLKQLFLLPFAVGLLVMAGCEVTTEEPGQAPDIDVQVEEGQLPEYDVEGPEVDVGTEQKEITVPDVDVELPSEDETNQ